jgi:biotin carboxylase
VKTILILGAGVMQEPAIRIARRKEWRVVLADGNPRAAARDNGDIFQCIDLKDRDGLLDFARSVQRKSGLDGVFTAGTDFSASVAWVSEKLGLPGITHATAMRATDKCLMREAFAAAGVPSPLFCCWTGAADPRSVLLPGMDYPLVVKPVDNMGARGVRRVENGSELADACHAALSLSRSSRVIIEQFMEGPEFSLDAVVYKGEVTICGVADRQIMFPPSFVEMGHTIPTGFQADHVKAVESVFRAGIRAIGIEHGAAKGDIKLTRAGPMVGEIAARLSGGYMSGWTFPLSSGVEVTEAALNVAMGLPPGDLSARWRKICTERALISLPGIVEAVTGGAEARQIPGVPEVFLRVAEGDAVVFPSNNVQKCGNVLSVADTREEAEAQATRALGLLQVRLRPLVEATSAHLSDDAAPVCFSEISPRIALEIRGMKPFLGDPSGWDAGGPLAVEPMAGWESIQDRDWHGMSMADSARLACGRAGAVLASSAGSGAFRFFGIFWRALLVGGHQGAVYALDSAREAARRGMLGEFLRT